MRINNNLMSMNAFRFMNKAVVKRGKSLEKLSTGCGINSASDNAAGLAISEKMRAQIKGLGRAEGNAQDGISVLQTVEGALGETAEILQRLRTLAVQSSNDTWSQEDRLKIQSEVDELTSEITRISNSVEFNGKKLLNGGLTCHTQNGTDMTLQIGAGPGQVMSFGLNAMDAHSLGVDRRTADVTVEKGDGDVLGAEVTGNSGALVDGNVISVVSETVEERAAVKIGMKLSTVKLNDIGVISLGGESVDLIWVRSLGSSYNTAFGSNGSSLATYLQHDIDVVGTLNGKYSVSWDTDHLVIITNSTGTDSNITFGDSMPSGSLAKLGFDTVVEYGTDESYTVTFSDGIRTDSVVSVAADATVATGTGDFVGIEVSLDGSIGNGKSTISLDIESGKAATIDDDGTVNDAVVNGGIDVSTGNAVSDAIGTIDEAIDKVSEERAKTGALQNRLDHVVDNILIASENLTASESRIRDVDMAREMMEYTRMEILTNVSQAMMAQANKNPEGILYLLRP